MTNLSEKLEQLSAAATQGELTAIGYGYEKYTAINEDGHEAFSTARKANAAFITELWNLYRTGQLVAVQADDADKKMYLCKEHSHWYGYGQDCPLCSAALAAKGDA